MNRLHTLLALALGLFLAALSWLNRDLISELPPAVDYGLGVAVLAVIWRLRRVAAKRCVRCGSG